MKTVQPLLTREEIAACIVMTEPFALKGVDADALIHFAQMAANAGAGKALRELRAAADDRDEALRLLAMAHLNLEQHLEYGFNPKTATSTLISIGRIAPLVREAKKAIT